MFANERRVKIAEMLERRSSVTVAELTDAFQVSLETIRRDLEYLERAGGPEEGARGSYNGSEDAELQQPLCPCHGAQGGKEEAGFGSNSLYP